MASRPPRRLPAVLARHLEGGRLREAFERVNKMQGVRRYDRTALTRWLSGESTPSDAAFMEKLAAALGDPEIVSARAEDIGLNDRELRDLVTRFRTLSAERKRQVLPELISELVRDDFAVRNEFTMRIELHADLTPDCHRLDLSLGWVGRLPGAATVEVVSDEDLLAGAYARDSCIFRELVPIDPGTFAQATAALQAPGPILRYKPVNSPSFVEAKISSEHTPAVGIYQFDNDDIPTADIRLRACLPYPADLPMYPVMLGAYAVAGRSVITMVTDSRRCGRPHALRFLGHAAAWTQPGDFDRSELSVEIGESGSLVEPNAGVIFFWRPARVGPGG
jgi:hypothetical protein